MQLPRFPYHPDPLATGFVVESGVTCRACGEARGYVYVGPVYGAEELDEELCPWCVADGSAAARFGAEFTDVADAPDDIPAEVTEQIARRTPGFTGWEQEHWLYHCGDGAAFLGLAGHAELESDPEAIESIREEFEAADRPPAQFNDYLSVLHRSGDATAYLFACRRCGRHLAYSDFR